MSEPPPSAPPARRTATPRQNSLESPSGVQLPEAWDIPSGHVWQPVGGRDLFAAASGRWTAPRFVAPWSPRGAMELYSDAGWFLHTHPRWRFDLQSDARYRLLALVRGWLPFSELIPGQRAAAVAPDRTGWRIWVVTRDIPSLESTLGAADPADPAFTRVLQDIERALGELSTADRLREPQRGGVGALALQGARAVLLSIVGVEEAEPGTLSPLDDLATLLARLPPAGQALHPWLVDRGYRHLSRAFERTD